MCFQEPANGYLDIAAGTPDTESVLTDEATATPAEISVTILVKETPKQWDPTIAIRGLSGYALSISVAFCKQLQAEDKDFSIIEDTDGKAYLLSGPLHLLNVCFTGFVYGSTFSL